MYFEWDDAKNRSNVRKHGVSFETASRIFDGPVLTWLDQREEHGEDRFITIGAVADVAVLVVAHTDRDGHIRLISARPASRQERQKYHEQIR